MKTRLALLLCLSLPFTGFAQESVRVTARGTDVRPVIHDLFQQAKKSYILDPDVAMTLYLSLNDVEFDEAFELICKTAGLSYEVQNGIYFIKADPKGPSFKPQPVKAPMKVETTPATSKSAVVPNRKSADPLPMVPTLDGKPVVLPAKANSVVHKPQFLDKSVLAKRVTTRLNKTDIRVVMQAIAKQSGVNIEVDSQVPGYRIDAILLKTSLKYALDRITKAANLNYTFTDRNSILITNGTAPKGS